MRKIWSVVYWDIQLLIISGHLFIGGRLHFKCFGFWFAPLSLSLKFVEDMIRGCWNILIFWGHLPLEVIFISSIFIFCWSTLLKFQILGRSDHRLMRYSTFYIWASLPLDVVFISSILFWFSPLSLSSKFGKEPISGSWNIHF